MGTGANCSFAHDNGTFVPQLCSEGYTNCCPSPASALVCSQSTCTSSSAASSGVSIDQYIFWVILAGAAVFTLIVLIVSYAVCRFRRPGCADASEARDRFLEENILEAHIRSNGGSNGPTHISVTAASSPDTGRTPAASPDFLVQIPPAKLKSKTKKVPVKKPNNKSVQKAFMMGAEAFARTSIAVPRPKVGVAGRVNVQTGVGGRLNFHSGAGPAQPGRPVAQAGAGGRTSVQPGAAARAQAVQKSVDFASGEAVVSPRVVHVGGFTPRVPLRDKGRTESKQTILSKDSDSLTTVST